ERLGLVRGAIVGRMVRVRIDPDEELADDALRADAIIVRDVRGAEVLTGCRHAAAGEDPIGARGERVERAVVGAGVEVRGRARDVTVTARLRVPEQGLAETDGRCVVDDAGARPVRSGEGGSGPSLPRAAFGLGVH